MEKIKKLFKHIELQDIAIFAIPFFIFLSALIIFYPGFLSFDTYNQLSQISNHSFQNWHPFIHTFIEMICMKIWDSPAAVGLFQIFCFSTLWTIICKYNRKKKTWYEFLVQIVVTIILSVNPLNICYSITLWKDILFSYGMLLLAFIIEIIIDKKYDIPYWIIVIFGLLMAFLSKIRFNGLFAIAIFLLIFVPIMLIKKQWKKVLVLLGTFAIGFMAIIGLERIYKVEDTAKSAVNTKVMHVIAYYKIQGYLTEKDEKMIAEIIDIPSMTDAYQDTFLDPIYNITNQEKATEHRSELIKIILREAKNHPRSFVSYALKSSVMTWDVNRPEGTVGLILWLTVDSPNNDIGVKFKNQDTKIFDTVMTNFKHTNSSKLGFVLFFDMALYMYLTIFVTIAIMIIRKKISYFLIILCNLINVVIVAASTPLQDIRYIYPNILIFYLTLIILLRLILNKNEVVKNEKTRTKAKTK